MTSPDRTRADRLYFIWQRRSARFRPAYDTWLRASDHAERVGRADPSYAAARAAAKSAARRMEIIHRQTARLARMQMAALGIAAKF